MSSTLRASHYRYPYRRSRHSAPVMVIIVIIIKRNWNAAGHATLVVFKRADASRLCRERERCGDDRKRFRRPCILARNGRDPLQVHLRTSTCLSWTSAKKGMTVTEGDWHQLGPGLATRAFVGIIYEASIHVESRDKSNLKDMIFYIQIL